MATQTLTHSQQSTATPSSPARPRLYKDYLTPTLHRRFTNAALLVLSACWIEAFLYSNSDHIFWSWSPIGLTGLRTLLLAVPCLSVFIVRVANIRIGELTTTSPIETVCAHVADAKSLSATFTTVCWYVFSAWIYGEVYIWSRKEDVNLAWMDQGSAYERPRLNENPIALRSLFLTLGVVQAIIHLGRGSDQLHVQDGTDQVAQRITPAGESEASPEAFLPHPLRELRQMIPAIIKQSIRVTVIALVFGFNIFYWTLLRKPAWRFCTMIGRFYSDELQPHAPPSGILHIGTFIRRAFTSSMLLCILWELSNAAFDIFVAQAPLHKGAPLTSESKDAQGKILIMSKDPNGSLITGLKSKKELPKTFAFWELYLICMDFEERRRTIFTEVERKDGSTFNQICKQALEQVEGIRGRIQKANEPKDLKAKQKAEADRRCLEMEKSEIGLPRIADQTVKNDGDVFVQPGRDMAHTIGSMARSIGQSPGAKTIGPPAHRMLEWGVNRALSDQHRDQLSRGNAEKYVGGYVAKFLRTPFGEPFRRTFSRVAKAVIFEGPHSNHLNVIHGVKALTKLVLCSRTEDKYGQVARNIPNIVRVFADTIRDIEGFVATLPPHWSDVEFTERARDIDEVRELVDALKDGLGEILLAFEEYAGSLGLSKVEIRKAKQVAVKALPGTAEMRQVRA